MGTVSRGQALEAMAKLSTTADWDKVDPEVLQESIIKDPVRAGHEFTLFLQNGGRVQIIALTGVVAPKDGRVHVARVPVNESRSWEEAVRAAGPNTGSDWDVWKVGNQYPPQAGVETKDEEVILVNFGRSMSLEDVLAWGREQYLRPKTPRACLAVSEHCLNLHQDLGLNEMAVVSLVPCSFEVEQRVVSCWWRRSERGARLRWFTHGWYTHDWFAFSRE